MTWLETQPVETQKSESEKKTIALQSSIIARLQESMASASNRLLHLQQAYDQRSPEVMKIAIRDVAHALDTGQNTIESADG